MEETSTKSLPDCHAEKCPVCCGFGTVNWGKQTCKACRGKGYIFVPNSLNAKRGERRKKDAHYAK